MKDCMILRDFNVFEKGLAIHHGIAPSLLANRYGLMTICVGGGRPLESETKCEIVGMLNSGVYKNMHDISRSVYGIDGLAPTVHTAGGGNLEPKVLIPTIAAIRGGRTENDPQKIEMGGDVSNCLTSVQKDNVVIEPQVLTPKRTEHGKAVRKDYENGTHKESRHTMTELEPRNDGVSNTLTSVQKDNLLANGFRIRKLTPRECLKLMDFDDSDVDKMIAAGISNSQIYKQAGNSIVVNVLVAIFGMMLEPQITLSDWQPKAEQDEQKESED